MNRIVLILATVAAAIGVTSSFAGAASTGPRTSPVPYAHGSEYVYSSSGKKVGTLTGSGLGAELGTPEGLVSK